MDSHRHRVQYQSLCASEVTRKTVGSRGGVPQCPIAGDVIALIPSAILWETPISSTSGSDGARHQNGFGAFLTKWWVTARLL